MCSTALENWINAIKNIFKWHFSTEKPKAGFNDTFSQHFVDELKHCNQDMQMELKLVPIFLC